MKTKGKEVEKKGLEITIEGGGYRKFRTFSERLETLERIFDAYGRVEKAWNLKEISLGLGPPLEWAQLSGLSFNMSATIIPIH